MPVKVRITLLFSLLVLGILTLVCASVYYFSYTNRIQDVQLRLKNRAITTGRLLSQSGVFDQKLIRRIDEATSLAMKDKVVEAYDRGGRMIYRYCDNPSDSILVDSETLVRARQRGNIYFVRGNKDAVAYYYKDTDLVIVTGAYDEPGSEKLRHLRMVLSLSFIGGLLSAIIVGSFFAVSLLRPLRRIADEVNDISARDLTRRIRSSGGGPGDEWDYLSDTLNSLLNRLQESFEIQGRFIANASHELSTPLTSISSQLEVSLQRVRSMEDYRRVIQSVYQDVQQMNKLTQTLLEFAKASGTAGGLEIDQVRIDEILLRLPGEISKTADGYSVTLDFVRLPEEEERLLVLGNEELLFMAVKNMVTNACKYSDDHHAVVRLSVYGREIIVEIEDKGRGIAEAEWEKIFQPFYRTDEGHAIPGFGLGLSLARRIIKLHKGEIDVESMIGEGSRFIVRLPIGGGRVFNSNTFLTPD
ncbi:MAG TPA: HAMP domain-containing sensor histidine kinase [Puia sp.]|jgi:signal transduction histidine kinase